MTDNDVMAERLCAWCGPLLIVLFAIGLIPVAGLVPPPSPMDTADTIVRLYSENATLIGIGMVMSMIAGALLLPWAIGLAVMTRPASGGRIQTYIQICSGVLAVVVAMSFSMIGSLAMFRPDDVAPETMRMLNDLLWYWWLIPWPSFAIWNVVVGAAILHKGDDASPFPRWSGYFSCWAGITYAPGSCALFFKTGPLAYDGLIAWYVPTIVFFLWILVMAILMLRVIRQREHVSATMISAPA